MKLYELKEESVKHLLEGEVFTFGKYRFDIDLVQKHIEAGDIPFTKEKVNICSWAEQILHLKRDKPDARPMSVMMRINYDHVAKLSDERMKDPVIVALTDIGGMFIDGNHRIAKAYLAGIDELEAYIFDEKATKLLNKPVKSARKRKATDSK